MYCTCLKCISIKCTNAGKMKQIQKTKNKQFTIVWNIFRRYQIEIQVLRQNRFRTVSAKELRCFSPEHVNRLEYEDMRLYGQQTSRQNVTFINIYKHTRKVIDRHANKSFLLHVIHCSSIKSMFDLYRRKEILLSVL